MSGAPPSGGIATATQAFADRRELLPSMVHNLLGTVADTHALTPPRPQARPGPPPPFPDRPASAATGDR